MKIQGLNEADNNLVSMSMLYYISEKLKLARAELWTKDIHNVKEILADVNRVVETYEKILKEIQKYDKKEIKNEATK